MDDGPGPIVGLIVGVLLTVLIGGTVAAKKEQKEFSKIYHQTHILQRCQDSPDGSYYYKLVPKGQTNESPSIQN